MHRKFRCTESTRKPNAAVKICVYSDLKEWSDADGCVRACVRAGGGRGVGVYVWQPAYTTGHALICPAVVVRVGDVWTRKRDSRPDLTLHLQFTHSSRMVSVEGFLSNTGMQPLCNLTVDISNFENARAYWGDWCVAFLPPPLGLNG